MAKKQAKKLTKKQIEKRVAAAKRLEGIWRGQEIYIPQWDCIHDALYIYNRR